MEHWKDWQKEYQFGTIVIWPPDEAREFVNKQRETYDPISQSFCETHITVTQPLIKNLLNDEWDQVQRVIKEFNAFEINYGPLNSFLPYPCIWYEIAPAEKLLDIRHALHKTGFFNLKLKHTEGFIPHMTITEGQSGPPVDESLLGQLQDESESGSFHCKELAFINHDEKFRFRVIRTLPLG
jgi:2'-5' RNA ligase